MTTEELTPGLKGRIDALDRLEMARLWRHAPSGYDLLQGAAGDYFSKRFKQLGGFNPGISKAVGWAPRGEAG